MKRFSTRQRVLVGALLLAGVIAGVDRFNGGGQPAPARAAQSAQSAPPAAPAAWRDVDAQVAHLTRSEYASVAGELEQLPRDIFVPPPDAGAVFAAAEPAATAEPSESEPAAKPPPNFREQHRLSGVLIGQSPVAVIDDGLLSLHAELDGFVLVQIERDYVVFQQLGTEIRVALELEQRPKNP